MLAVLPKLTHSTLAALLACVLMAFATTTRATSNQFFAITLASSLAAFTDADHPPDIIAKHYHVYITRVEINNRRWHRMNLGFFRSRSEAAVILKTLRKDKRYNDAWIRAVTAHEYRINTKTNMPKRSSKPSTSTPVKAKPTTSEKPVKPRDQVKWNGSFSQFSTRDTRFLDNGDTDTTSILFNDFGISGQYRSERLDVRTQFDTSYRYTFNTGSTTEDQFRVSSMYVDFNDNVYNTGGRLGRQSASRGGVLGRFDGAWLSYRASPRWKYNLVAGYPVELSTSSTINETDRYFVGMSVDMGTFARVWDLSAFGISQQINGIVDRQAMGGEIRYSDRNQSHLLLVDYDTSYQVMNSVLAVSNWFLPTQTSINIVLDSRTVPVLTTSNALIGRTEKGIDDLLAIMSEDEIRQLALDRTSRSYSATLGLTHPVSDKYQVNAEVTGYRQKDTPASGGVAAVDYGGTQMSYALTVIGSSVFKEGDISIAGMRYSDSDTTRVSSVNFNVRYPLTRSWRVGPALVLDYRNNTSGIDQVTVRPSVRLDYRWLNNITFDAELALLHIKDLGDSTGSDTDVFFELGYRIDF